MAARFGRRAAYRVRQFVQAMRSRWTDPDERSLAFARRALPDAGWRLFRGMPRADQLHALKVWTALRSAGFDDAALAQAALLHDVAKHLGGVKLFHRVAVVLIKALAPRLWKRLQNAPEPSRRNLLYPLWAHANHPATGARLALGASCLPEAVTLIRRHQETVFAHKAQSQEDRLLLALQRADDDN